MTAKPGGLPLFTHYPEMTMPGPWIRTGPSAAVTCAQLTEDHLLDLLASMGKGGRNNYSTLFIRAAFAEAGRRGISTPDEVAAGIKQVLRIPLRK